MEIDDGPPPFSVPIDIESHSSSSDINDKGDTVVTAISHHDLKFDEEDDEWGDFGAAEQKPAPLKMEDDDDEWGDFDQARPSTDRSESAPDSARSDQWVSASAQVPPETTDDDDWQAEFSSAPVPEVVKENLKHLEEMLDDEAFWDDGFDEEEVQTAEVVQICDIPSVFDAESLEMEEHGMEQRIANLWLALRVVEEAISLKFDWKESQTRKEHFRAIKVVPKTVEKQPRLFDTSSILLPTPLQPSPSSEEGANGVKRGSVESPSIPAADFDWDTSGLTNPMNRANQSSAIIDVDFLGTNGKASSYTSPLQKELEQFGLANGSEKTSTSQGPNILETLMSQANGPSASSSQNRYKSREVLSLDAQKLLEKLPDLQYLQSEVLMFPVGTNLPH